jgi:hypothetical protein
MTLGDYLELREGDLGPNDGVALLFDQFEEILSVDPTDTAAKETFFTQLGDALAPRHRWALFSMRDDYVGALEPYLRPIPTQLSSTFHLDLLDVKAALQAMQRPVRAAGAEFADAAAQQLTDDLRRVRLLHRRRSGGHRLPVEHGGLGAGRAAGRASRAGGRLPAAGVGVHPGREWAYDVQLQQHRPLLARGPDAPAAERLRLCEPQPELG